MWNTYFLMSGRILSVTWPMTCFSLRIMSSSAHLTMEYNVIFASFAARSFWPLSIDCTMSGNLKAWGSGLRALRTCSMLLTVMHSCKERFISDGNFLMILWKNEKVKFYVQFTVCYLKENEFWIRATYLDIYSYLCSSISKTTPSALMNSNGLS